jgi:hypothetical protein
MQRIKIPYGGVNPEQMVVLAELAEEYSDAICHITTRQDIQLHFVNIEDTPDIFRRLAAVGILKRSRRTVRVSGKAAPCSDVKLRPRVLGLVQGPGDAGGQVTADGDQFVHGPAVPGLAVTAGVVLEGG